MKCPKCNGRGTVGYFHIDHFVDIECDRCNGSGEVSEVEMTNEEWLRQCNMEQLADVLLEHFEWGLSINAEYCFTEKYVEQNREHILEWLKQPHHEKE